MATKDQDPASMTVPAPETEACRIEEKTSPIEVAAEEVDDEKTETKVEMDDARCQEKTDAVKEAAKPKPKEEDPALEEKRQQIREACHAADCARLQQLAISPGGFVGDDLRQLAWPLLLGIPVDHDHVDADPASAATATASTDADDWTRLPAHRDEDQVQLDVNRAFVHYPRGLSAAAEASQKQQLSRLIVAVLRRHPFLCYFQGFHDICQVFLLVLAATPAMRTPAVTRLALLRIRDFMLPTIDAAVQQLQLLPDILRAADPALWNHLRFAQHPRPFFALSGTLTMYAHDVQTLGAIARVFDVLLAYPPAFSLYLFAAIACAHRDALFATPADEPEMLHHILSKLPARAGGGSNNGNDDDDDEDNADDSDGLFGVRRATASLDNLIADAHRLYRAHPPPTLASWRAIPPSSVLKTVDVMAAATTDAQTAADGERLFHAHVLELARAEKRRQQMARVRGFLRQYRGPIRAVGVAVLVGAIAIALQRSGYGAKGGAGHALWSGTVAKVSTFLSRLGDYLD